MAFIHYPALVYRERGEQNWTILFPDFPEIASAADPSQDVDQQAMDALATAIDVYNGASKPLPEPSRSVDIDDQMPSGVEGFIGVYTALEPEPLRVNISIDRALLARIDAMAERKGMTRSGFLAIAARAMLARESRPAEAALETQWLAPG
jgi:predicted RNase H-like HicB family nuclease